MKCRKYFKLCFTAVHHWVEISSLYLECKVEVWIEGFLIGDHDLTNWVEFVRSICTRLGSKDDVMEELNKLVQEKGI